MGEMPTSRGALRMADEDLIRVRVEGETLAQLRAFTDETDPDLGCRPVARRSGGGYAIDVFLPRSQVDAARGSRASSDVVLTVLEDVTATGRERQADVGRGDRFAARDGVPRGLGRKE